MEKLHLDLAVSLFFVVALVLMARKEHRIKKIDRRSYRCIAAGVSFFAILSLFTALNNMQVFQGVAVMSNQAMFEFFQLLMLIAGLVLVSVGVARWLSIMRTRDLNSSEETKQVLQAKMLAKTLISDEKLDLFLTGILNWMYERLELKQAAVFSVSTFSNHSKLIGANSSINALRTSIEPISFDSNWLQQLESGKQVSVNDRIAAFSESVGMKCFCLPVRATDQTAILFLLWTDNDKSALGLKSDEVRLITEAVRGRMSVERMDLKDRFRSMCHKYGQTTVNAVTNLQDKNEMLMSAMRALKDILPVELLSLTFVTTKEHGNRLTVGETETILNEVGISIFDEGSYLSRIIETNNPLLINDINEQNSLTVPRLFTVSGMRSLIAVPLPLQGEMAGVLTIASSRSHAFTRSDIEITKAVSPAFERILEQVRLEQNSESLGRRERVIDEFLAEASNTTEIKDVFKLAAAAISGLTGAQMTRISTYGAEDEFLSSQALVANVTAKNMVPENGYMILALMPLHKTVRETGDRIVIDCANDSYRLTEAEASQAFIGSVTAAAIIPIKRCDRLYGTISVADTGPSDKVRFSDQDMQLLNTFASMLALFVDQHNAAAGQTLSVPGRVSEEVSSAGGDKAVRRHLKSSLTGIIGSLEMIKSGDRNDEVRLNRFLSIIDKSARKLNEYLTV